MSSEASGQQPASLPDASAPTETAAPQAAASTPAVQPAAAADGATGAGQLTNSDAPAQAAAGGSSDAASAASLTEPAVEQSVAAAQPVVQPGQMSPCVRVQGTTEALDDWLFTNSAFGISCGAASPLQLRYGPVLQAIMYSATADPADGETYFVLMDIASSDVMLEAFDPMQPPMAELSNFTPAKTMTVREGEGMIQKWQNGVIAWMKNAALVNAAIKAARDAEHDVDSFVGHSTGDNGVLMLRARWTGWSESHDTFLSVLEMNDALRPKVAEYCGVHGLANPYAITSTNSNLATPKGDGRRKAYSATEDGLLMRLSDTSHSYNDMVRVFAADQRCMARTQSSLRS